MSNKVRDCDVVLEWLDSHAEYEQQVPRIKRYRKRAKQCLEPLIAKTHRAIKRSGNRRNKLFKPMDAFAHYDVAAQLLEQLAFFLTAAGEAMKDESQSHSWRVTCKHLRYGLDFFVLLGCDEPSAEARRSLQELQHTLGLASDVAVRVKLLGDAYQAQDEKPFEQPSTAWFTDHIDKAVTGAEAAAKWLSEYVSAHQRSEKL